MGNWQKNAKGDFKKIKEGSPSSYWSSGLQRRLDLIHEYVDLQDKKILDIGSGLGMFMRKFLEYSDDVYGIEVDPEKVKLAPKHLNLKIAKAEEIPFEDEYFDVVFMHEVLEHVDDDKQAIDEAVRVLRKGGYFINFCPNKRFPFETHGIYLGGKYIYGNIPLVTYLPFIYDKLTPHVRNYTNRSLIKLYHNQPVEIIVHKHVYPGYDGLVRKFGKVGSFIQKVFFALEKTPLEYFGISHMLIVRKNE